MRRRTLLVVLSGLAVVVAAGVVVLWPGPDQITLENYHEIRMGMSLAEVEAILGPVGDYRTAPATFPEPSSDPELPARYQDREQQFRITSEDGPDGQERIWVSDDGEIWVLIRDGGVRSKNFIHKQKSQQSALENLLWRVKRQWRRWFPE
jgi:hypothetical protein